MKRNLKLILVASGLTLVSTGAFAQQSAQQQGVPQRNIAEAAIGMQHDVESQVFTLRQVIERLVGEWEARAQRILALEAYAKACGDKPGCFVSLEKPEEKKVEPPPPATKK